MRILIAWFPVFDVISFEMIKLSFFIQPFSYLTINLGQIVKCIINEMNL